MGKNKVRANVEDIKDDIRNLVHDLAELKNNSGEVLSESFEELTQAMTKVKNNAKEAIPFKSKLLYKAVSFMYGDTIKRAVTIIGISTLIVYLFNRKRD